MKKALAILKEDRLKALMDRATASPNGSAGSATRAPRRSPLGRGRAIRMDPEIQEEATAALPLPHCRMATADC